MNKTVAVTSGKGGTGKSTFSVNLGIAAASRDNTVLLIDMDAGMRCLDMLLGVWDKVLMDVSDVVGGVDLESSVIAVPQYDGLYLLPAPAKSGTVDPDGFARLINKVSGKYSLVIIDFPAGSDYSLYEKLPKGTDFICVCNPNPVSVRDAAATGLALRKMNRNGYLIINKYSYKYTKNQSFKSLDDILDETGLRLLGIIPQSSALALSFTTGKFPRKGREARAFKRVADRLFGKSVPIIKLKKI